MKQRKGPVQRTVGGLSDSVVGAVRRRQQDRAPRVKLYDRAGHARVLPPDAPGHAELIEVATELVSLVPRRAGREGAGPGEPGGGETEAPE